MLQFVDPSIDNDTFFDFGALDWNALTAMATKTGFPLNQPALGPRFAADGSCDFGHPENWGDPLNPTSACGNYFPIIYAPGNLRRSGGQVRPWHEERSATPHPSADAEAGRAA